MGTTITRMTVEEFRAATVPGDHKHLVDGEIVVNQSRFHHSLLQGRIFSALASWVDSAQGQGVPLFPTDVELDEHNVFGPDVIWFAGEYRPPAGHAYPDRIPDLCVEVRSPSTWRYDIGTKKSSYERGGLPELWLVDDVAEVVLVCRRSEPGAPSFDVALELGRGEKLRSEMLPGFELALDELFAD